MTQLKMASLKLKVLNRTLLGLVVFLVVCARCFAGEVTFEATVNKAKVALKDDIELSLTFYGAQDLTTPYFPGVDGFNWRYLGPAQMTSIINGQVSTSISHRYLLIPLREGSFTIPSFSVQYRGKTYTSQPIAVEVAQKGQSQPYFAPGQNIHNQQQDIEDAVFLVLQVDKRQAYLNEVIPLKVKLYVNNLALRDIQYPQITHEGFSIGEFQQPLKYQETIRGMLHSVIEFKTTVVATKSGELTLGPAQLESNLLIKEPAEKRFGSSFFDDFFNDDFFARYRTYPLSLKSADITMTILPLPQEGQPQDFSGAVGDYSFSVSAEPKQVKVGDPVTFKMTISGAGDLEAVGPPSLNLGDNFKVYDPDIHQEQTKKTFEQVIIPRTQQISEIPQISFSFFNPQTAKYQTIVQGPIALQVEPLPKGEKLQVFEANQPQQGSGYRKEVLGQDIIYLKAAPGKLKKAGDLTYRRKPFGLILFLSPLMVLAALIWQRRRERLAADVGYARRLRAPGKARKNIGRLRNLLELQKKSQFFDLVFKTLQEYLGDKFHLASAGITTNVVDLLRLRNINPEILNMIKECFASCDLARYALAEITKEQMQTVFESLQEIIDRLERIKG